ncbi:MAG: hypothetical protein GY719_16800 [bacterium]|nr:hypothetical protein [bacterium]
MFETARSDHFGPRSLPALAATALLLASATVVDARDAGKEPAPAAATAAATIELLDPGSEPRIELRLTPTDGAEQVVSSSISLATLGLKNRELTAVDPRAHLETEHTVTVERSDPGSIHLGIESSARHRRVVDKAYRKHVETSASIVVDHQGSVLRGELADPWPFWWAVAGTYEILSPRFPPQPVGQGAKWRLRLPVTVARDLSIPLDVDVEIESLGQDRVVLAYSIDTERYELDMKERKILWRNEPGSAAKARNNFMSVTGAGNALYDLRQVRPVEAELYFDRFSEAKKGKGWNPFAFGDRVHVKQQKTGDS